MRPTLLRTLGFLGAGLLQAASIAWPGSGRPLWWLQLLSMALLFGLLDAQRDAGAGWRRAGLRGWLFGTAWLAGTFWWLFISMHTYGGLAAPLAALAVLALAGALALYYAAACAAYAALAPRGAAGAVALFSALWTLAELLRGHWFTGFPWGAGGYAHVEGPLAGYAPWVGVYGIGAAAAALAACLGMAARQLRAQASKVPLLLAAGAAALALAPLGLHAWRGDGGASQSRGTLGVALLQGNIPQDEKFVPGAGIGVALRWYAEQLQTSQAPLVVTPETAIPLLPRQLPAGYWAALAARFSGSGQAALVGLPLADASGGYANSLVGLLPQPQAGYRYDKHHLVPFGEFIPPGFGWFIRMMNIPLGDFQRGALPQAPLAWQGQRIAPNVCYEDLFGEEIGAGFRDAASAPTVLLNVSNIAWFGGTVAIDQHLAVSRMRALEFQRPMLRATNTGATAVIDHRGVVTHQLPRLTRGVLEAQVEGRAGITPYAWWVSRLGLAPLWVLALLAVAAAAWRRRSGG